MSDIKRLLEIVKEAAEKASYSHSFIAGEWVNVVNAKMFCKELDRAIQEDGEKEDEIETRLKRVEQSLEEAWDRMP